MPSLEERYLGCLVGLACGDALGGPVEFQSRDDMDRRFPNGLRDFIGGGWLDLAPGEVTDDTQMTLDVARSLCAHPEGDMDDLAQRFVAWQASNPKDIGNTTRDALDRLCAGVPWYEAGQQTYLYRGEQAAAGNGAIMRCAPVALRFRNEPEQLQNASADIACITHAHPLCIWSSIAVNRSLAALLNEATLTEAIDAASIDPENEQVRDVITRTITANREEISSGGFVLDTLNAAWWSLLRESSFEETLVTAVGLGGDTDTTGAVAGALAGAFYGFEAIPSRWRDRVQYREELIDLASCLLATSSYASTS